MIYFKFALTDSDSRKVLFALHSVWFMPTNIADYLQQQRRCEMWQKLSLNSYEFFFSRIAVILKPHCCRMIHREAIWMLPFPVTEMNHELLIIKSTECPECFIFSVKWSTYIKHHVHWKLYSTSCGVCDWYKVCTSMVFMITSSTLHLVRIKRCQLEWWSGLRKPSRKTELLIREKILLSSMHAQYSEVVQESWSADPGCGFFPMVLFFSLVPPAT